MGWEGAEPISDGEGDEPISDGEVVLFEFRKLIIPEIATVLLRVLFDGIP